MTDMFVRIRRPTYRQAAILLISVACVALFAVLVPLQSVVYGTPVALSFLLGAGMCGAPLLMLTRPRLATAMMVVAQLSLGLLVSPTLVQHAPWPWSVPAMLALLCAVAVATAQHGARMGSLPLIVGAATSLMVVILSPDVVAQVAAAASANLIVGVCTAVGVYLLTLLITARLRVGAELDRERAVSASEHERRLRVEERTRIARELHDIVAHSMSVIQVQAATARYRVDDLPEAAAQEFDGIAATARTSLTEMRRLLGVLRTEEGAPELTPQQGIADIPELIDSIRSSGASVSFEQRVGPRETPAGVALAAFRIAQEALSNALRHAPGAPIAISLEVNDSDLRLRVRNAPPGAHRGPNRASDSPAASATQPHLTAGNGHGLRGMRERAAVLGGTVQASATADGGWLVDTRLPLTTPDPVELS
ncbi:sensor histidine kinase [Microbacterium esteraromaticum]|uniref:sensor histidine kinase n=1 Tax=Microbacterium esteraromaticum TaxID=57043 RepID=UPI001CD43ECB|nr:sensor histidine kinase [Microbacterium esteraromaticum]MCA1306476.1 sensor histidine kinase [Microbacterium esteraromaticum]